MDYLKKCESTLDKYLIINTTPHTPYFSLRKIMKDILLNIIQLQEKKYVQCDIKADNIMICGTDAKLIA